MSGQLLINQETAFDRLSLPQLKATLTYLRVFKVREEDAQKAWCIDMSKMFQEKSLRVHYITLSRLEGYLQARSFHKLPDPRHFLYGVSQLDSGLAAYDTALAITIPMNPQQSSSVRRRSPLPSPQGSGPMGSGGVGGNQTPFGMLRNFKFEGTVTGTSVRPVKPTPSSNRGPNFPLIAGEEDLQKLESDRSGPSSVF